MRHGGGGGGGAALLHFAGEAVSVLEIKHALEASSGMPVASQRLVGAAAAELSEDLLITAAEGPRELGCLVRVMGGKGGFGAMLRSARGGLDAKKTTNFDAMRDLSGRRMRHVNNEQKLKEWVDAAPDRAAEAKREKDEAAERKRVDAVRTRTEIEVNKYASQVESVREAVGEGVAAGIAAAKKKRKREAAAAEAARLGQSEAGAEAAAAAKPSSSPAKRQRVARDDTGAEAASTAAAAGTAGAAAAAKSTAVGIQSAPGGGPKAAPAPVELGKYTSAAGLLTACGAEAVKQELMRMGLKCGGTPEMRAERLWSTKGKALKELDPRLFAKKKGAVVVRIGF